MKRSKTGTMVKVTGMTSALLLLSSAFVGPGAAGLAAGVASAATLGCGETISHSTVLTHDVGPCPPDTVGITVTGRATVLDLGGHRVFGSGTGDQGLAIGILLQRTHGAKVTRGSVDSFDAGVVVNGGEGNAVTNLDVHDNIGPSGGNDNNLLQYGDGILVIGSNDNRVSNNLVDHNGPLDGVGIIGLVTRPDGSDAVVTGASRNRIINNQILDNNTPDLCPADGASQDPPCVPGTPVFQEDMGIRLEGPSATYNLVVANMVQGNGVNGVLVDSVCVRQGNGSGNCDQTGANADNLIVGNTSKDNGFGIGGPPGGFGIRFVTFNGPAGQVNPHNNTVLGNTVTGNAIGGIAVGKNSTDNRIIGNLAINNDVKMSPRGADLVDSNLIPPCDNNVWQGNRFGTANQSCIH
ncbi:MAG TPA: right-handed parallel beta-helix repeat-containing protein [Acidimicrobiales bacterium]|nr:right-handed parallel beta-helix repeat-containing protein [Acidimicrobiales bacterium]